MKNKYLFIQLSVLIISNFLLTRPAMSQQAPGDSSQTLKEITIKAYLSEQPLLRLTASAGIISNQQLSLHQNQTLVPALNTVPGVRMEERSPGSYRLSIRGSLLRSPFGVRNVKIYFDEIPLTDAGGNTYLNAIDPGSLSSIHILKGPDGSLYGANSGGVVLLQPNGMAADADTTAIRLGVNGGSYGLFQQQLAARINPGNRYRFSINQAFQQTDGYRDNSAMKRNYFQTVQRFNYNRNNELRLLAFYSDLQYLTPGGLTAAQYAENPAGARPAAGPNPGSAEQHAGIYSKTLFGGLVHDSRLSNHLKHVITVFGSYTDFRNPFITNYEKRYENNYGIRTYLEYAQEVNSLFSWRANAGIEWQQGSSSILNYDNNAGQSGAEQAGDLLRSGYHFYFARFSADIAKRLSLETALSLNYYGYGYRGLFPDEDAHFTDVNAEPTWMPRFALSYLLSPAFSLRLSAGKGYSPATTAEVRSSDKIINTDLRPETGWNYETGLRWQTPDQRFTADASVFYYRMQDAIIRLERETGEEFFGNAGGVDQKGIEAALSAWVIKPGSEQFIRGFQLSSNITLSRFRFNDYQDFSGNKLTGVPAETVVSSAYLLFPKQFGLFMLHNYTSSIPLDDANSVYAKAYHVLQAKASWNKTIGDKYSLQLFAGADNLLNQRYSLGNDINAFGGRFFNAAPLRNYYAGIVLGYQ